MKKKTADKKVIQEAIKSVLNKTLNEGPLGIFDKPMQAVGAVGNMFSNIGGQMKLGAINKQLDRTAQRIEADWDKAEDVATKLATKMQTSKNPNIKNSGEKALRNIKSASNDIKNASDKIKNLAGSGVDKEVDDQGPQDTDPDFQNKVVTTKMGNTYVETPVERWVKSFGGDYKNMGSPEKNHVNRLFMELRASNINPFKIPKEKQALLLKYTEYRNSEIANTGNDPFPNDEHFEKVLGKKVADEIRKNKVSSEPEQETPQSDVKASPEQQVKKKSKLIPGVSPSLQRYVRKAIKFAKSQGVSSEMMDKWLASQLEKIKNTPELSDKDREYLNKLILKGSGQPTNAFGGQTFNTPQEPQKKPAAVPPPIPDAAKKQTVTPQPQSQSLPAPQPQVPAPQQAVKVSPIKSVGSTKPSVQMPKQDTSEPLQIPKLADFFGSDKAEPMDASKLPIPEEPKTLPEPSNKQDLSLKSALPQNPPMIDKGNEVQVGSTEEPAFQPTPPPENTKKKVSSRKKKK